ncbi:hypothetical protein GCM10010218_45170 [Streptomyces mashuensis]|uniref:IrrE N-terminal-like domain-containing protein n=1 Tax=Streptomyces mashuensis TaxID=33904 RepID=A0A919B7J5_9ACTN|nr:hypothetical protein [Streptomyces mashuensis]GHF58800.1 hypothetical protein GCM10010218_45170 [Streptomyces mashuensis]
MVSWAGRTRRTELKRLRRRCEELLAGLDIPVGSDLSVVRRRLSEQRGRPIYLAPVALRNPTLYGLWIGTDTIDVIAYESDTSRAHQEHIIAHEFSHILCGHAQGMVLGDSTSAGLFTELDPEVVRRVLQRSGYSDADEREAETMASLILTRTSWSPQVLPQAPPEVAGVLARIESVIGTGRPAPAGADGCAGPAPAPLRHGGPPHPADAGTDPQDDPAQDGPAHP